MKVKKAVITAAGRGARQYPASNTVQKAMQTFVDRDGLTKPVIQIIGEEAIDSGIETIAVIVAPGDEEQYRAQFESMRHNLMSWYRGQDWALLQMDRLRNLEQRMQFITQDSPEGYGHAVWCAKAFVGDEPFLLLLGDHLYISGEARRCATQIMDLAAEMDCSVAAVQETREHLIHLYGTICGKRLSGKPQVYVIEEMLEKPNLSVAETKLLVPGLRPGHYLCFFGMHVLVPRIFEILDRHIEDNVRENGEIQLTPAMRELAQMEKYLALETCGHRYNIGVPYGYVEAQIALALAGKDRETMLSQLVEILLQQEQRTAHPVCCQ
ncbi:MAG: sugar phosphate nucleotidyltransferase [bacterium]|jgi:UTP--glucose-1-phosphate uridylyltransferase|nr:sugar phosphate nucleotidyltransferase [bacterium]